jgi:hypothetical protein
MAQQERADPQRSATKAEAPAGEHMPELVNCKHQVKRGERRKTDSGDPRVSPLFQDPGAQVG